VGRDVQYLYTTRKVNEEIGLEAEFFRAIRRRVVKGLPHAQTPKHKDEGDELRHLGCRNQSGLISGQSLFHVHPPSSQQCSKT
jgi:hypothetical protein